VNQGIDTIDAPPSLLLMSLIERTSREAAWLLGPALAFCLLFAAPATAVAACTAPLVAGGEAASTDCQLELHVQNPTNEPFYDSRGRVNPTQTCVDGDASCDGDGTADGTCRFRIQSCFGCSDPLLPTCNPLPNSEYGVFSPSPTGRRAVDVQNAEALLASVMALQSGTRTGRRDNVIRFDEPLGLGVCTESASFAVPIDGSRPGRAILRSRAIHAGTPYRWDADYLRLICLPANAP
jgi:hypothetical protein